MSTDATPEAAPATRRRRRFGILRRRDEGQAAFEFLLILPLFIMFVLLLVDFAILGYEYVSLSNAVREGTRYGAVLCHEDGCEVEDIQRWVADRSGGLLDPDDGTDRAKVDVGWSGTAKGDRVVVAINHPYDFLFFPATIPVVSCADMRLERDDQVAATSGASSC